MACKSVNRFSRPRKQSVFQNYEKAVMSAFKWDCETFLDQFEKKNSLSYADFANLWQINNFTYIFADQTFVDPLKVLCKVCFLTVQKYLKFQKSLHIKVGAFFLLYGLYYKQPIEGMVKIRLTLEEYRIIKHLMDEMLGRKQYDILYVFAKMKSDNVFWYTAEPNPINIELIKCVKSTTHLDDTFQSRGTESSLVKFKDILEDPTVQALQKTCGEYDAMLKKYAVKNPGVLQFKSTIVNDLQQTHNRVFGIESEADIKYEATSIRNIRQNIRCKAMQNQNAEYRGSKIVLTAVDLEEANDDDDDDDDDDDNTDDEEEYVEIPQKNKRRLRGRSGRPRKKR